MNVYSNSSNARAAARKLAAKYPDSVTVDAPIKTSGGFYAAVSVKGPVPDDVAEKAKVTASAEDLEEVAKAPKASTTKKVSKSSQALTLMRRKGGVTAEHLQETLNWLPHTVRGFVSHFNKDTDTGEHIDTVRKDGVTKYHIGTDE